MDIIEFHHDKLFFTIIHVNNLWSVVACYSKSVGKKLIYILVLDIPRDPGRISHFLMSLGERQSLFFKKLFK
jgi:hypothetical protein